MSDPAKRRSRIAWPTTTPPPKDRRKPWVAPHRHSRIPIYALSLAVLGLVVAVVILFMFVLSLKDARDREAAERQAAIDRALCSVIGQFPSGFNFSLDHVRAQLNCPPPALEETP